MTATNKTKLFIVVNVDWFFLSHRLPIALAAVKRDYDVTILAIEEEGRGAEIRSHGLKFIPLPSTRGGKNFFSETKLLHFLYKTYKKEKPDIIHHVAIKPVLYGTIAAKWAGAKKVINAVSGLGSTFIDPNIFSPTFQLVKRLYRLSLSGDKVQVIAQNKTDIEQLLSIGNLKPSQIHLIEGSGVDLNEFQYTAEPAQSPLKIILPSRMLYDKGIGEFVEAARAIKQKFKDGVEFILAGKTDPENKSAISKEQLEAWTASGNVNWIGYQSDMLGLYMNSNIVVLPSYREGLPKSLIEACAIGRAIVTTDVPGCRDVVKNEVNGFLVQLKDARTLEIAITKLIEDAELRKQMGLEGRKIAEKIFSIDRVIAKTFEVYEC